MKKKKHSYDTGKNYYEFEEDAAYLAEDEEALYDTVPMETLDLSALDLERRDARDDMLYESEEYADKYEGGSYESMESGRGDFEEDMAESYEQAVSYGRGETGYEEDGAYEDESYDADAVEEEYYADEAYEDEDDYYEAEKYDTEAYEAEEYDSAEYGSETYKAKEYDSAEYGSEAYEAEEYDSAEYGSEAYEAEEYDSAEYGSETYEAEEYDTAEYGSETYEAEEYDSAEYGSEAYESEEYDSAEYDAGAYESEEYESEEYESETYGAEEYGEYEERAGYAPGRPAARAFGGKASKAGRHGKKKGHKIEIPAFLTNLAEKFSDMTAMDRIVAATGAFVLILAMVTCSVYASAKAVDAQVEAFAEIGGRLESVGVAGGTGLLAMADAQNYITDTDLDELFENETDRIEADESQGQQVVMNMTSVEKDLKIKFVNKANGKLISGIAFEVSASGPDGKADWKDDDKDGVIYQKDLTPGSYKIALQATDALEGYKYDTSPLSVTVKNKIEYKKIDVTDEVKTEAEVNAAVEDTQVKSEVESTLKDTVEWVESTRTALNDGTESGYTEIDKKDIPDPATIARAATGFLKLSEETTSLPKETQTETQTESAEKPEEKPSEKPSETTEPSTPEPSVPESSKPEESTQSLDSVSLSGADLKVGETKKLSAEVKFSGSGTKPDTGYTWKSDDQGIATVGNDGTVTARAAGSTKINVTVKAGGREKSASATVTVTEEKDTRVDHIQIDGSTIALEIGGTATLSVKAYNAKNEEVSGSFTWSSSNTDIAEVDKNSGRVTGKKAGEAKITAKEAGGKTAEITVKVNAGLGVSLDKSELSLNIAESSELKASVTGTDKKAEWSTSDSGIATVSPSSDGKSAAVKGIKAGEATVTVTVKDSSNKEQKATCKVKVAAENTELKVSLDKTTSTVFTDNKITLKLTVSGKAEIKSDGYAWSTDNDKIASIKVAGDKKSVEVKGLKKGEARITIKVTDVKGNTASAECKVTVKPNPKDDDETRLKDKDGNTVYILNDKGEYVKATYKDYYTAKKFFIKGGQAEYKYTGWQTLDGKTYYFDKNGKKVTGDQVIKGAQYSFDSDGVLRSNSGIMGIDVSKWNGNIDWKAVKNSGVSYVIIRCGYRGSSTGAMVVDPKFKANIQGATNAGLKVGIYFFSQAVSEREAVEEASMTLSLIKGYKISYPVFLDLEGSGGRGDKIDKGTRTAVAGAFCKTIQNGGYTAGIYANKNWFETKMNTGSLTGYKLWLAQYASSPTYKATRYDMWQYTSKGSIPGISGNVDLNLSYLGY